MERELERPRFISARMFIKPCPSVYTRNLVRLLCSRPRLPGGSITRANGVGVPQSALPLLWHISFFPYIPGQWLGVWFITDRAQGTPFPTLRTGTACDPMAEHHVLLTALTLQNVAFNWLFRKRCCSIMIAGKSILYYTRGLSVVTEG